MIVGSSVVTDYTGAVILQDDAVWCEREQVWCHKDDAVYVNDVGEYATPDAETRECDWSLTVCFRDDMVFIDIGGDLVSRTEREEHSRICDECDAYMHEDDTHRRNDSCHCLSCYQSSMPNGPDSIRQGYITKTDSEYIPSIKQSQASLPSEYKNILYYHYEENAGEDYYTDFYMSNMNFYKTIHITGTKQVFMSNVADTFFDVVSLLLKQEGKYGLLGPYAPLLKLDKPYSAYNKDMIDVKDIKDKSFNINISYSDAMGNTKQRIENINKIFDYVNRLNIKELKFDIDKLKEKLCKGDSNINWVLSNEVEVKSRYMQTAINSCQFSGCDEHSMGLADMFTNHCNLLLIASENGEDPLVDEHHFRILVRLMIDSEGKEYLFFDRPYGTGGLTGDAYKSLFYDIVIDVIKKGYNVVVSDKSEHGDSNLKYLENINAKEKDILKFTPLLSPLRQPAREHLFNDAAYYSDSGVATFSAIENGKARYRDKIKSTIIYSVTMKDAKS